MKNVKIYEVKSSAANNAEELLSPDDEFFFWDNNQFTNNEIGDIIFFINKSGGWALYTKLSKKGISTEYDEHSEERYFDFNKHKYVAKDANQQYDIFYQFKIFQKTKISKDWNWTKYLGVVQIYDLWRNDKELIKINDRLDKISDLKKIFPNGESLDILNRTENKLNSVEGRHKINYSEEEKSVSQTTLGNRYRNLLLTIKTKPFIILAGLSGTGKSRLVRTMAYKTCPKGNLRKDVSKPGNFELIKVRPNWHDSTEVVGYESRINGERYVITDFIRFMLKAWKHPKVPFFLCLDEMNLAPVEQYFAEYLSVFETRKKINNGAIKTDAIISPNIFDKYGGQLEVDLNLSYKLLSEFKTYGLTIPQNLVVMGTVNMDETTHSFSPKVLDRAMTIEKNNFDLTSGLEEHNEDWTYEDHPINYEQVIGNKNSGGAVFNEFSKSDDVIRFLQEINQELKDTPFMATYRVRDEFLIYCYHYSLLNDKLDDWLNDALDHMMHMKILPKIEGEAGKNEAALNGLQAIANARGLSKSIHKIEQMIKKLDNQHYTSYWY